MVSLKKKSLLVFCFLFAVTEFMIVQQIMPFDNPLGVSLVAKNVLERAEDYFTAQQWKANNGVSQSNQENWSIVGGPLKTTKLKVMETYLY